VSGYTSGSSGDERRAEQYSCLGGDTHDGDSLSVLSSWESIESIHSSPSCQSDSCSHETEAKGRKWQPRTPWPLRRPGPKASDSDAVLVDQC
jgi:hypothetical protein